MLYNAEENFELTSRMISRKELYYNFLRTFRNELLEIFLKLLKIIRKNSQKK